jgi:hypothetical protein
MNQQRCCSVLQLEAWQLLLLDLLPAHPVGVEAVRHTLRQLHLQQQTAAAAAADC